MSVPPSVTTSITPASTTIVSTAPIVSSRKPAVIEPSGMLFVRSLNGGVSHSPDEHTSDEDVALAIDALELALRKLL